MADREQPIVISQIQSTADGLHSPLFYPFTFFIAAVNLGITSNASPTIP